MQSVDDGVNKRLFMSPQAGQTATPPANNLANLGWVSTPRSRIRLAPDDPASTAASPQAQGGQYAASCVRVRVRACACVLLVTDRYNQRTTYACAWCASTRCCLPPTRVTAAHPGRAMVIGPRSPVAFAGMANSSLYTYTTSVGSAQGASSIPTPGHSSRAAPYVPVINISVCLQPYFACALPRRNKPLVNSISGV